jgi:anti-anti-sigma factor
VSVDSEPLEVEAGRQGAVVTATLRGELDLATAEVARAVLRPAVADGAQRLELDLAQVTFVDSSGLALFLELASSITVAVVAASTAVRRIVETTGLQEALGLASPTRTRELPAEPGSIRLARRFVADHLTGNDAEWVDLVTLATSELASNCVIHARTAFTISVDLDAHGVRVSAVDDGAGLPEVQHPDPSTPTGRGLLIIERLSDDWGAEVIRGRTEVWFRMQMPPGRIAP